MFVGRVRRLLLSGEVGCWVIPVFAIVGILASGSLFFSQKISPEKQKSYWVWMTVLASILLIVVGSIVAEIMDW